MKRNRAQVTLFIILGFVIFIGFVFTIYIKNERNIVVNVKKVSETPFDIQPVKVFVENCIEDTAKNALILIGNQGGYYELKKPYFKDNNFNLSYYFFNNLDFSPSLADIEKEISKYIDKNLDFCINDFEEFKKQGFEIIRGDIIQTDTKIEENSVLFNVNFPITIKRGDHKQQIEKYSINIPDFHLKKIHSVSKEITNYQINNPNTVCLSCLYELAEKNNLIIDIIKYTNTSLIFDIRDYNRTEDNVIKSPYNFTFAIKLIDISCDNFVGLDDLSFIQQCIDEQIKNATKEIQTEDIPNFQAKINEPFYYHVNAYGNKLKFYDYSELFDITDNGIINFTPNLEQIGNHSTWVSIKDILGNEQFKNFNIEVTE